MSAKHIKTDFAAFQNGKATPEYAAYCQAKARCNNPNHPGYKDYGGRGIRFLFASFAQFLAEVGRRPEGRLPSGMALYSIHRIENDGNYEPGNVKWATQKEQCAPGAYRRRPAMPAELSKKETEIIDEVCSLLAPLPDLPLSKLASRAGTHASVLCNWQHRRVSLRPGVQRQVRAIVRTEFARYAAHVAELAARHGIEAGA
jgi:hypothetical protein